jgi:hypothetical protein
MERITEEILQLKHIPNSIALKTKILHGTGVSQIRAFFGKCFVAAISTAKSN